MSNGLYGNLKSTAAKGNERRIKIDEVNVAQKFIQGRDSMNRSYRATFDAHYPVLSIPEQGEMWVIVQYQNEWRLSRKFDTTEQPATSLSPGDRRLEATNNLVLNGDQVLINKIPFGATFTTESLPDPDTVPAGTIVFVSDAIDGEQFQGSNGTTWKTLG